MRRLTELQPHQCRYPVSGARPAQFALDALPHAKHLFCAEPVTEEGRHYCDKHMALCYTGHGRDWKALYDTFVSIEHSVEYLYDWEDER